MDLFQGYVALWKSVLILASPSSPQNLSSFKTPSNAKPSMKPSTVIYLTPVRIVFFTVNICCAHLLAYRVLESTDHM